MAKKVIFSLLKNSFKDMRVVSPGYFRKVTITDRILDFFILRFIPSWVTPNQITILRFISVPALIVLLISGHLMSGTILFALAAFSDALDGALARTRKQITNWGIVNDPLADKLLIGSTIAIMVTKYIHPILAFLIIGLEIIIFTSALYKTRYGGKIIPAKLVGKIKMILESLALVSLFVFVLSGWVIYLNISTVLLYLVIVFALLSLFVYKSI